MLVFSTLATTVPAMTRTSNKGRKSKNNNQSSRSTMKKKKKNLAKVTALNAVPAPAPALPAPALEDISGPSQLVACAPALEDISGPSQLVACAPATKGGEASSKGKEKAKNKPERHSGFIFMCNMNTKPECFRYRVFGLPAGKKEVVGKIKEGTKLFLFDFDVKLLYGVYKATCQGQMNLEASAFGGRYPAQVKFSIFKDSIPLPESVFKTAIKDNYQGSKFDPELNAKQVRGLLSLFRSCVAPTAPPVAPYPVRELPRQDVVYHPHLVRHPPPVDPYVSRSQYNQHVDAVPRFEPPLPVLRHEFYGSAGTMGLAPPTIEHQGLPVPPSDRYYAMENRHPYFPENSTHFVLDRYPRFGGVQEMVPRGMEAVPHRLPLEGERGSELLQDSLSRYYNTYSTSTVPNNAYPPTSRSYSSYPSTAAPLARTHLYPPHSVESGKTEPLARSDRVSSLYSFAGANQVYR